MLTLSDTLEAEISLKLNINMTGGRKGNQGAGIYGPTSLHGDIHEEWIEEGTPSGLLNRHD